MRSTRRGFLVGGAAAGAGLYTGGCARSTARPDQANVLVIVLDTLRVDHAYGDRARTPALDELVRQGLRFSRVFPEAMPTVPARNAILSGRRQFPFRRWEHTPGLLRHPGWSALEDVGSAFTTVLRRAGWWTGYVTDNPFLGFASPYEKFRRSFDLFIRHGGQIGGRDAPVPPERLDRWLHPAIRRTDSRERVRRYIANADYADDERASFAAQVFTSSIEALERAARRRPFALIVDSFQPHEPWTPPRLYTDLYGDSSYHGPEPATPRYGRVDSWLREDEISLVLDRMRALYAAEVTMTDRWMGALLERLRGLGLDEETQIVLVSDHGIFLGERGWTGKISIALHPELIQVPLVIVDPTRRRAGEETAYLASTHDIAPTILATAGVDAPVGTQGVDLSSLFESRARERRADTYGGYSNQHFVRTDRWAYMADNRMQKPKLFDLNMDAVELHDVAEEHPDIVRELQESLRQRVGGYPPYYE